MRGRVSTNLVEAFFALVKRAYFGVFHWWSRKHAHRYADEIAFRWVHRHKPDGAQMVAAIRNML